MKRTVLLVPQDAYAVSLQSDQVANNNYPPYRGGTSMFNCRLGSSRYLSATVKWNGVRLRAEQPCTLNHTVCFTKALHLAPSMILLPRN